MRIGLDISPLAPPRTGVGSYVHYLVKALLALPGEHRFYGFSTGIHRVVREMEHAGLCGTKHLQIPTRAAYKLWDWVGEPKVDRFFAGLDVFHATNFFLPPTRHACRVVTIHDLGFLVHPEWSSPKIVGPYSAGVRRFVHEADAVLVYSESTKRDILRLLDADASRIHIAPLGVDEMFSRIPSDEARERVARGFGVKGPFLLFVSTLEPRKNVAGAIRAFEQIAGEFPHSFVLAGVTGWNALPIVDAIRTSPVSHRIRQLGYVPDSADIAALYSAADAFLFPSHYEGFGLPVLEALACGCPVVTSNAASLPEVAGDAALMSRSGDIEAIADNLRKVLTDFALRQSMIAKGLERASQFTWRACAEATLETYRKAADARSV